MSQQQTLTQRAAEIESTLQKGRLCLAGEEYVNEQVRYLIKELAMQRAVAESNTECIEALADNVHRLQQIMERLITNANIKTSEGADPR